MQLYARSGQRSAALRQYQECVRVLRSELGVSPQASTTALYRAAVESQAPERPVGRPFHPEGERPEAPAALEGEGRLVSEPVPVLADEAKRMATVLVTDTRESFTGMSEIGSEDEALLVDRFLGVMKSALARYGGWVGRTLGGSILAVFGAEQTRESDAELAIRAAIDARQEAGKLGLRVCAGISTGEVFFRSASPGQGRERTPVGRAIDRALHLAGWASDGQILVGQSTHRLTRRAFEFTPLLSHVKGRDGPVRAYHVERLLPQPKKARGIEGLRAELIGRDEELAKLKAALADVLQGQGRMVSLVGEAGVGKTRLVAELKQFALTPAADRLAPLWLEGRCLELGTAASYAPFSDILRQYFAWSAQDDDRQRGQRILSSLREMAERGDRCIPGPSPIRTTGR